MTQRQPRHSHNDAHFRFGTNCGVFHACQLRGALNAQSAANVERLEKELEDSQRLKNMFESKYVVVVVAAPHDRRQAETRWFAPHNGQRDAALVEEDAQRLSKGTFETTT